MKVHTYSPPKVHVVPTEDGNRLLVAEFEDGEQIVLVLAEAAAKEVGRLLVSPAIATYTELPPGVAGL